MKQYATLLILLLGLGLSACTPDNNERRPTISLESCRLPGGVTAQCGMLTVDENRDLAGGRTIDLDIAVLPATGTSSVIEADPLLSLIHI